MTTTPTATWRRTPSETLLEQCKYVENRPVIDAGIKRYGEQYPSTLGYLSQKKLDEMKTCGIIVALESKLVERPNDPMMEMLLAMVESAVRTGFTSNVQALLPWLVAALHKSAGMQTYEVSADLIERLKMTSLQGVEADDLRLPFRACWFQFPAGSMRTQVMRQGQSEMCDVLSAFARESMRHEKRFLELVLYGKPQFQSGPEESLVMSEIPLDVGWNPTRDDAYYDASGDVYQAEAHKSFMGAFWDVFVNLLMYAVWPEEGQVETAERNPQIIECQTQMKLKAAHKRQPFKDRLKTLLPYNRIVLGRTVQPFPEPLPEPSEAGEASTRASAQYGSLVQGHWKRYAVGEGRKERRWVFRQPFWRGPATEPRQTRRTLV